MATGGEQRPPTHFPEAGGRGDSRGRAPPLSGREDLLVSRKFSDLNCKGCLPQLTPWRQEPAPTPTSNNPKLNRKHFSKSTRGPDGGQLELWGAGRQGGWPSHAVPHQLQLRRHRRLSPEDWWPRAAGASPPCSPWTPHSTPHLPTSPHPVLGDPHLPSLYHPSFCYILERP